jgi:hypothetical protein
MRYKQLVTFVFPNSRSQGIEASKRETYSISLVAVSGLAPK